MLSLEVGVRTFIPHPSAGPKKASFLYKPKTAVLWAKNRLFPRARVRSLSCYGLKGLTGLEKKAGLGPLDVVVAPTTATAAIPVATRAAGATKPPAAKPPVKPSAIIGSDMAPTGASVTAI